MPILQLVGPNKAVQLFGITLVGVNAENGRKLLLSILFLAVVLAVNFFLKWLARVFLRKRFEQYRFWISQGIQVLSAVVIVVGIASIWFDDPGRLATAMGLITAGLAFALQRVVTAVAGYIVILRGNTFSVGDRIVLGGVRGDVIALNFTQTTIMEMGQPPGEQGDAPSMWVHARQYTGRVVTVTNAKVFDEAVFNYSRDFPFVFEEMRLPVPFSADHDRAESILLESARKYTVQQSELGRESLDEMRRRYFMEHASTEPRVYWRLTDNWLELTVRFVVREHGVREVKDKMAREILSEFGKAGIGIASSTFEIVGLPPVRVSLQPNKPA